MSRRPDEHPETILVVDDNLQNREVAEGHLIAAGYGAVLAEGGERALEIFAERPPDLVLLDVLMPRMDGFETCRRLRALPGGADTPILFLTALGDLGTHKAALDSGADDFLTKPINRTELLIRIRSLLRIGKMSGELKRNYELIRQQRDELLEAQQQRRELSALIVHDLKNPISSNLSNVQYLVDGAGGGAPLEDGARGALGDVLRAARSMFRMVMNLLDVSRSEDGALVPRCAELDLAHLLREIYSEVGHRLEEKAQTLRLDVAPEVTTIIADGDIVRRVVENLIDNAFKYGPRRGAISIEVVPSTFPGSGEPAVELRIRDQGEGIPPAYRRSIFEPYVRIEDRKASEVRNSQGLGLVFCRRALEVHGGEIWVEDNPPKGSCFCVRLGVVPRLAAVAGPGGGAGATVVGPDVAGRAAARLALSSAG